MLTRNTPNITTWLVLIQSLDFEAKNVSNKLSSRLWQQRNKLTQNCWPFLIQTRHVFAPVNEIAPSQWHTVFGPFACVNKTVNKFIWSHCSIAKSSRSDVAEKFTISGPRFSVELTVHRPISYTLHFFAWFFSSENCFNNCPAEKILWTSTRVAIYTEMQTMPCSPLILTLSARFIARYRNCANMKQPLHTHTHGARPQQ